ncbi:MAG: efflux RND transporter permease subunit [Victivallaceae bacterium]|nr:efflux RND transporter permease subunit [Victivallaceae bacterium]
MNLATFSIRYKTVMLVLTVMIIIGGIQAYFRLGKLEDPEYTIKTAVVITQCPGAVPEEVENEVTDKIEKAVRQMEQIKHVRSLSQEGRSTVYVDIKDKYTAKDLPQIWDELRRKVNDVQPQLPPEAAKSVVRDDYGDVYGVFYAITGDGYTYAELRDFVDFLKNELLLVDNVARIEISGIQDEVVYIEFSRDMLSRLGITPDTIYAIVSAQNAIVESGKTAVGPDYVRIYPTGKFTDVEQIGNLVLRGKDSGKLIRLKDVATITRGYEEPPKSLIRLDGKRALGMGISTVSGGNVVTMGEAIKKRLAELEPQIPVGMELGIVSYQSDTVKASVNDFILNLIEAVAIVIVILVIFMGPVTGLLIGFILLLTILATFIGMKIFAIDLQSISLGALIIALGMLFDNAIVVAEGVLVGIQTGQDKIKAAEETVGRNSAALLGATIVAVLAFAAIGLSPDSTGEYCRTLFYVVGLSLLLSWVLAVTVTPVLAVMFLKAPAGKVDPYAGKFYRIYRTILTFSIRCRWGLVIAMGILLALAIWGFGFIKQSFFPTSESDKVMFDIWNPEGTYILQTSDDLVKIEQFLKKQPEVNQVTSFIGAGAQRFILNYNIEDSNDAYGQLIVEVTPGRLDQKIAAIGGRLRDYVRNNLPDSMLRIKKFEKGSGNDKKIELRISGHDPLVLRELAEQVKKIMRGNPHVENIRTDWRHKKLVYRPQINERNARRAGLTQSDIAAALRQAYNGRPVGLYRENDRLLTILSRAVESERNCIDSLYSIQIWSNPLKKSVNLYQLVTGFKAEWDDAIIRRRDGIKTLTVQCDPLINTVKALKVMKAKIDTVPLPLGYSREWGGEFESSSDAQKGISGMLPITFIIMMFIVLALFNALRQTLIIILCLPLALIGVTVGLLGSGAPFSFFALLGLLSLIGMMIKNGIVLIQEIDDEIAAGKNPYDAVVDAGICRFRPVLMAALTTVLGMLPLLWDVMFNSMAITIMCGLTFATALTLLFVPVLYCILMKIPGPDAPNGKPVS